jgi:hypothetical protein
MNPNLIKLAKETKGEVGPPIYHTDNVILCAVQHDIFRLEEKEDEVKAIRVIARRAFVDVVCVHGGRLYHAESVGDKSWIYDSFSGEKIAEREGRIECLCSFDDYLFDGGKSGVYKSFENEKVFSMDVMSLWHYMGALYCGSRNPEKNKNKNKKQGAIYIQ